MANELDKNDLFLLMDSYKNMIDLNRTILEQQKHLMTLVTTLAESQKNLCDNVDKAFSLIQEHSKDCMHSHTAKLELEKDLYDKVKSISDADKEKESNDKETGIKLGNRINLLAVGLASIVVPLVILMIQIFSKFDELELLHKIAEKLLIK